MIKRSFGFRHLLSWGLLLLTSYSAERSFAAAGVPANTAGVSVKASPAPAKVRTPAAEPVTALDLGPEEDAARVDQFVKPPGPVQGGTLKVPHPGTAQGLMRINKDGSYQYRTKLRPKTQAMSFRVGAMTPPSLKGRVNTLTYKSMYGSSNVFLFQGGYEWAPFRKYGPLGVQLEAGFATANGNGTLESGPPAEEKYTIVMIPMSVFGIYRFEYMRRQWIVPYINGGLTYYGLAEKRDDDSPPKFAGALAAGGGGGVHLSISRLDSIGAFTLDREYGIADMWLTIEARATQGLDPRLDFTNQAVSVGLTLDY